ncbi:hypothetical protein BMH32_04265 [Leucobacter sp. OLJS4]|uniref:EsaB/YukD family protein n=2 Tax=Leucobacter TaxID=55968 RepID=UPI000C1789C9|nr:MULTISPECIES: EsaB/YukD family protein [unclassified Leucobacter]PII98277.1 hypothetical protein BMH29_08915 [Leucobacter sp. OLDS2]PII82257.1 hypothetical protein BMH25_10175 [Leucobacter sp. OLCALW19]PII88543.1 hypothetical protein BMH26_05685 [Leucobacter sp. OLTLW20]PII94150.1 hypothetical protein BMH27_01785 [Leucobacter sp. OLAS13]PIJ03453.1 hypothetical protein BMH31_08340 [Leucobacter sp. OLIS6]
MNDSIRMIVRGASKRATIVVPADEPLASLLPDITMLLEEQPSPAGFTLVTPIGTELDLSASLAEQDIATGTVLRVLPVSEAPSPPEVSDVTDAVAEHFEQIGSAWGAAHRFTVAAVALGAVSALITLRFPEAVWLSPALFIVSLVAALGFGWAMSLRAGMLAAALGIGAVPALSLLVAPLFPGSRVPVTIATALLLLWVQLGAGGGRRAALGAAAGGLSAITALIALALGATPAETAAVLVPLLVLALGMLPTAALSLAGVSLLDDRGLSGELVPRVGVVDRAARAYGAFGWAIFAVAGVGGLSAAVLLSDGGIWTTLLGLALLLIMLLRTRIMPLPTHRLALWGFSLLGLFAGGLARTHDPAWVLPVAAGILIATALLLALLRPRPHSRVRLRRLGDLLEALAALAVLPLMLGVFGIYEMLLRVF